MIHLLEILIVVICFGIVFLNYKKISKKPEDKSIAIFSTTVVSIGLITLMTAYFWVSYNQNIWGFFWPEWQQVNTKGWNDVNYFRQQISQSVGMVAAVTNPIMAVFIF